VLFPLQEASLLFLIPPSLSPLSLPPSPSLARSHACSQKFLRDLPNASLEVVSECGHLPHLEKPVEFAKLVKKFQAALEENTPVQPEAVPMT